MKKLLRNVISFAIIAVIVTTQSAIAGDANYTIQVKNKYYDKAHNNTARKGLSYTSDKSEYTSDMWFLVEGRLPYTTSFTANYYDPYNRTTTNSKTCYVKQFAVSKGVVYWINPTENVIRYWNTVDGTSGTLAPTGTYQGASYPFKGSDTGYGSITHDWYGNLVHVWNGKSGTTNNINTPARGYAVYKAPNTYGTVINSAPVLSDMPTCTTLHGRRADKGYAWTNSNSANPNILGNEGVYNGSTTMTNLNSYGLNGGNATGGTDIAVDYISASGNLFNNVGWVDNSTYQAGYWGGQVWHTYGHIVTGNMFADGAYSNWFMNYLVTTTAGTAQIPNGSYGDGLKSYSREFFFQEAGGSDQGSNWNQYYYSSPNRGFYQTSPDGKISHMPSIVYPRIHPSYAASYYSSDPTLAPDIQRLKGYRIIANNLWKAGNIGTRNGSIEVNVEGNTNKTGESRIGYGYAYGLTENPNPIAGAMNGWLEYEKVNENVLALYTYVPGQGFSKYFVTAVRKNNTVSGVSVSEIRSIKNLTPQAKITWTAQPYDRETLHRYLIYYKAYESSTAAATVDNMTWQLATVDANGNPKPVDIGTSSTGEFIHNTPIGIGANNSKHKITYKYLIVPIYDGSDHMGEETETASITPEIPVATIKGNFYQVTDNGGPNGETRYGFSLRLDPYFDADAVGAKSIKELIITSDGGWPASYKLEQATSVTLADGTPLTWKHGVDITTTGGGGTSTHGAYSLVVNVEGKVDSNGKLPSIIWHNIDPDPDFADDPYPDDYGISIHANYTEYVNFKNEGRRSATITIPTVSLSMNGVSVYPLNGDYSNLQRDEILPLGARRKKGSNEVTNPVTISRANTLGTKGSAINPLLVTDEVMENWNIEYDYNVYKNNERIVMFDFDASNTQGGASYYSNYNKVMFDIAGLPIKTSDWNTHTAMELSDNQKATNDNLSRKEYDDATANDNYVTRVDVTYTRKVKSVVTSSDITTTKGGVSSTIDMSGIKTNPFDKLNVDLSGSLGVLFQRTNTHWDASCTTNGGYYSKYYDGFVQVKWDNAIDRTYNPTNLNRYIGFHAVTNMNCVGHNITDANGKVSKEWIPYYAGSVLTDYYVEQYNKFLARNNLDEFALGIGYTGNNTNWSALAEEKRTLPLDVHYMWAGDEWLQDGQQSQVAMSLLMTADYPIIESKNGATLLHNANNDDSYYTLEKDCQNGAATMNMVSMYSNNMNGVVLDYLANTTGVEGVLTNACGGVKIYPNPVQSSFTLEAPMDMGTVKIFSTSGQLVKEINNVEASRVTIIVDDLPRGVYIVNTLGVAQIMMKM